MVIERGLPGPQTITWQGISWERTCTLAPLKAASVAGCLLSIGTTAAVDSVCSDMVASSLSTIRDIV